MNPKMSFFIKSKRSFVSTKSSKDMKKRKFPKREETDEVEELTSGSDDEIGKRNRQNAVSSESSDDDEETSQEKKLRLAKIYLKKFEKKEKVQNPYDLVPCAPVAEVLNQEYLESIGKCHKFVANKYRGADVDNIKILKCLDHRSTITCICVTSQFIFSGSKNGTVVKWSIETCQKVGTIPYVKHPSKSKRVTGHSAMITSIAVSTDMHFLAVSDETRDIQIWNPINLQHINTLLGHRNIVMGLIFRKRSHTLYSCSKDWTIKIWSLDEMAFIETLHGHQNHVISIDVLAKERPITAGNMDGSIRIWKIDEESQQIYNATKGGVDVVKYLNEETFVSGSTDGAVNVWSIHKKTPLCTYKPAHGTNSSIGEPNWISSIATLVNTDLIASGACDGFVKIYKLSNNFTKIELLFSIEVTGYVNEMAFTPDGKNIVVAVGNEHRFGRWCVLHTAKISLLKIPFIISN